MAAAHSSDPQQPGLSGCQVHSSHPYLERGRLAAACKLPQASPLSRNVSRMLWSRTTSLMTARAILPLLTAFK